jgi:hypothetical protein
MPLCAENPIADNANVLVATAPRDSAVNAAGITGDQMYFRMHPSLLTAAEGARKTHKDTDNFLVRYYSINTWN